MLSGLFVVIVVRPEFQKVFWGLEPDVRAPGPGTSVRGITADAGELSWRDKLAGFAHSREMVLLFGAILPLALLLRLLYLGANSLDEDEIFTVILARKGLPRFLWTVAHREANMVLYYTILKFWINLGQSELAVRSLSVIFALLTVLALHAMGTRAFGRDVGCLGAILLAINGFHVEYSQVARSYSLFLFLVTLSSLFFLQSIREGSRRNWIRYIVTSTLAIYAHLFAVLVLVAHWVFLFFIPRRLAPWRRFVPSTAAIALLALPMAFLVLFGHAGQPSWIPRTTARNVYNLFACLAGKPDNISLLGYGPALLLFVYSIPVAISVLALAKSRPWSMEHAETWPLAFFVTLVLVPILVALGLSIHKPIFYVRYLIICLPPFILLAAHGLSRLRRAWLVVALLGVITGLTAPGLLVHYELPDQDWSGIAQYVLSNQKPGDVAFVLPAYCKSMVEYYLQRRATERGPELTFLDPPPDSSSVLQGFPQYDRAWLILRQSTTRRRLLTRWPAQETFISVPDRATVAQERSIEAALASEFPGTQEEKLFPGELVVALYHK
jgi:4-amino-4-deoxy-L-arabinose transferase-like glycosyltransferase